MARYRIEFRTGTSVRVLSTWVRLFKPLAWHLAHEGQTGEVVLIDVTTNAVINRIPVQGAPTNRAPLLTKSLGTTDDRGHDRQRASASVVP
jgi:hypothetical protein